MFLDFRFYTDVASRYTTPLYRVKSESLLDTVTTSGSNKPVAMAVVLITHTVVFIEDEVKLIGRGENAFKFGCVEQCAFDGTSRVVRGKDV